MKGGTGRPPTRPQRRAALTRPEIMSRIRGKDTKPELLVRQALWSAGLRYRLHVKGLPGSPDIVLPGRRIAILVHGCFWHCHDGCPASHIPKTRTSFWEAKFARNVARDARVHAALHEAGWEVIVVWECAARDPVQLAALAQQVKAKAPRPRTHAVDAPSTT